jgi:hypothetical protein
LRYGVGSARPIGLFLATGLCAKKAKDTKAKSYTFHGKVEAVTAKGLTVNGEEVKGWMGAMTINYPLDKPAVLKNVKVGRSDLGHGFPGRHDAPQRRGRPTG